MNKEFLINDSAIAFYSRWKRDTMNGLLISTPLFFSLFIILPLLINGPSIGLFLFFVIPLTWIVLGFIYTPFFKRKNPLNFLVRRISILHNNTIAIETFSWFSYKPILASFDKEKIEIIESTEINMLGHKNVFLLKSSQENHETFYIVQDFFDNSSDLISLLSK